MAYNANIPLATDQLNVSQGDLMTNFQALAPFGNGYALLANTMATPGTDATHVALYAQLVSGALQLFFERENNGTAIPFTAGVVNGPGGWSLFPSGLLMAWGSQTSTTFPYTYTYAVLAPSGFPGFNTGTSNPIVLATPVGPTPFSIAISSSTPAAFTAVSSIGAGVGIFWAAFSRSA